MSTIIFEKEYRCSDDCIQSGCPGHKAKLEFNTVSQNYRFSNDNGQVVYFEHNELQTFLVLLKRLSMVRLDAVKL